MSLSACTSETVVRSIRPETDAYLSEWIVALSVDPISAQSHFTSEVFSTYESNAGAAGGTLALSRAALVNVKDALPAIADGDIASMDEATYVSMLCNIAVALERYDLPTAHSWLQRCGKAPSVPANAADVFLLFLQAKWDAALGNHFKATNGLLRCDNYLRSATRTDVSAALAAFALTEARAAGITAVAAPIVAKWINAEATNDVRSIYDLAFAQACQDLGVATASLDTLYERALAPSLRGKGLVAENVLALNQFIKWKLQRNDVAAAIARVDALCNIQTLQALLVNNVPGTQELLYQILLLDRSSGSNVSEGVTQFARDFFTTGDGAESKFIESYKALNASDEEAEASLEAVLSEKKNTPVFLSEASSETGERVYKAFSNVRGRRTRANVRIRGVSDATLRALGLDGLGNQNSATNLDVPSLQTMNALLQREASKGLFEDAGAIEEVEKVDRMVEAVLKESALSFANKKNDSVVDISLQAVQAQVNAHAAAPLDGRLRFVENDADYNKYVQLKAACRKAEKDYETTTRSGSASALRNARKEFVEFITSKDQLALSNFTDIDQWKLKQCTEENVMVYYAGKEGAYLLSKAGGEVAVRTLNMGDSFADDIAFVLNKGMDLSTVIDDPEVSARYYAICRRWYRLLVNDYWPAKGSEVVIVPIGFFAFINWDCLDGGDTEEYHPLIHDYKVRYEADVASLFTAKRPSSAPVKMAGFASADYPEIPLEVSDRGEVSRSVSLSKLNGAVEEVSNVCQLFEGKAYTRATPADFLASCDQFNVMLVSTHGVVLPSAESAGTNLVFSADASGRYLVHAEDFLEKNVRAELIALPSCNSALGNVSPAGGLKSLSGSLLNAGAASVVASIHELPDKSTSEIVRAFFKYLRSGQSKSDALRQAKLDYLQQHSGAQGHPVFWSGLIFMGDAQPLNGQVEAFSEGGIGFHPSYWWLSLLIFPIALTVVIRRRKRAAQNGRPS